MPLPFLNTIGLTDKEGNIYQLLLEKGELPASAIIKESKLKRPTVYKSLYTLEAKGLVVKKTIAKKIHFRPTSPTNLLTIAEEQFRSLERAKDDLAALMPELTSSYILSVERPVITQFEGIDGIKRVFEDIYAPKKEPVYGCIDLEVAEKAVPAYITKKLIPLRIKNNVTAHSFIAASTRAEKVQKQDAKHLRKSILLDKENYPLPAEIDVYEDKVAFLSFTKGQFVGILIKNQGFATSLKTLFKLAFEKGADQKRKKKDSFRS